MVSLPTACLGRRADEPFGRFDGFDGVRGPAVRADGVGERLGDDRAADQLGGGDVEEPAIQQVHGYEIHDDAPMSRRTWGDPDVGFLRATHEREGEDAPPREVPEHKRNRIYPYTNKREDSGSTTYVIPSALVGRHVTHLGVQFQGFHGSEEQYNAIMHAATTMLGGKIAP